MSRPMIKPTQWHVRPAKTQISLGIRPVWSESSLSAWRKLGSLAIHWAYSENSDQTGRIPRLIWVFAEHTCHFVGFVTRRLNCSCSILEMEFIKGKFNLWKLSVIMITTSNGEHSTGQNKFWIRIRLLYFWIYHAEYQLKCQVSITSMSLQS